MFFGKEFALEYSKQIKYEKLLAHTLQMKKYTRGKFSKQKNRY